MYLLCSDWSIRSLEKEKEEKEKEKEENCHLLNTARRTDEGRDKKWAVLQLTYRHIFLLKPPSSLKIVNKCPALQIT